MRHFTRNEQSFQVRGDQNRADAQGVAGTSVSAATSKRANLRCHRLPRAFRIALVRFLRTNDDLRTFPHLRRLCRGACLRSIKEYRRQRESLDVAGLFERGVLLVGIGLAMFLPRLIVEKVLEGFILGIVLMLLAWIARMLADIMNTFR